MRGDFLWGGEFVTCSTRVISGYKYVNTIHIDFDVNGHVFNTIRFAQDQVNWVFCIQQK